MSDSGSLDALLEKINSNNDLKVDEPSWLSEEEQKPPLPDASESEASRVASRTPETSNASNADTERNPLGENNLTPRQRALPKLPLQLMSGVVAVMVMMAGVGAATMLSQDSQDIRQQAFRNTTSDIEGPAASLTEQQLAERSGEDDESKLSLDLILNREWNTLEIVIASLASVSIVVLLIFLLWVLQD